jgi:hypothetical protein
MELLMDMFDSDALTGTNLPNLNRIKSELDYDPMEETKDQIVVPRIESPCLIQNQIQNNFGDLEPYIHNILDTSESVKETHGKL